MSADLSVTARLGRLLPHWAEHCGEHVDEIAGWRVRAGAELGADAALPTQLLEAEQRLALARDALRVACLLLPAACDHDPAHPHSDPHQP